MASDVQRYKATMFQVGGFSLMSPLGNIVLNLLEYDLFHIKIEFIAYVFLALALFGIAIILLGTGIKILEDNK